MKTADIWIELMSHHKKEIAKEFRSDIALGIALSSLASSSRYRHLVSKRTLNGHSVWTIRQEQVEVDKRGPIFDHRNNPRVGEE